MLLGSAIAASQSGWVSVGFFVLAGLEEMNRRQRDCMLFVLLAPTFVCAFVRSCVRCDQPNVLHACEFAREMDIICAYWWLPLRLRGGGDFHSYSVHVLHVYVRVLANSPTH